MKKLLIAIFLTISSFAIAQTTTIWDIERFVHDNVRSVKDSTTWGVEDHFQLPQVTLDIGTGDCEDQALLVYWLAQKLGVTGVEFKVGTIKSSRAFYNGQGHAFNMYKGKVVDSTGIDDAVARIDGSFNYTLFDPTEYASSYENVTKTALAHAARDGMYPRSYTKASTYKKTLPELVALIR